MAKRTLAKRTGIVGGIIGYTVIVGLLLSENPVLALAVVGAMATATLWVISGWLFPEEEKEPYHE